MSENKKCPYCAEDINKEAIKCKYCGEWLGEERENASYQKDDYLTSTEKEVPLNTSVQEPVNKKSKNSWVPGFRTGKWWKKVIASIVYGFFGFTFLISVLVSLDSSNNDAKNNANPGETKQETTLAERQEPKAIVDSTGNDVSEDNDFESDFFISLLKKSFDEVKKVLGEPDDEGYLGWYGEIDFLLYEDKDIFIYSPHHGIPMLGKEIVTNVDLGEGNELLGVEVGMTLSEIEDVLGPPDYGPEVCALEGWHYISYYIGDKESQSSDPEISIIFNSDTYEAPTSEASVRWNYSYEYPQEQYEEQHYNEKEAYFIWEDKFNELVKHQSFLVNNYWDYAFSSGLTNANRINILKEYKQELEKLKLQYSNMHIPLELSVKNSEVIKEIIRLSVNGIVLQIEASDLVIAHYRGYGSRENDEKIKNKMSLSSLCIMNAISKQVELHKSFKNN